MATESVATAPTIEIPAQSLLDKFEAGNDLGCLLEGLDGILGLVVDDVPDDEQRAKSALYGAIALLEQARKKIGVVQFSYRDESLARKALGLEEA